MSQNTLEQLLGFTPSNDLIQFLERGEERLRSGLSGVKADLTRPNALDKRYPPGTLVSFNDRNTELIIGNDGDTVLYTIAPDFTRLTWSEFETPRNKQRIKIIHRPAATHPDLALELLYELLSLEIHAEFVTGPYAWEALETLRHPEQLQVLFLEQENRWLITCLWTWLIQNHSNPLCLRVIERVIIPGLNHRRKTFSVFDRLRCEDMSRAQREASALRENASHDEMAALRTIIETSDTDPAALLFELQRTRGVGNRMANDHRLRQVLEQLVKSS